MKTLRFLNLNLVWYYNYFYYHSIHVFWKGIHIYSQEKMLPLRDSLLRSTYAHPHAKKNSKQEINAL